MCSSHQLNRNVWLNIADIITYQRGDEVNAGHIVHVIHFYFAVNSFISTWLDTWLENVRVVEMLHRLSTEVNAKMLQLTRLQHEGETRVTDKWSFVPAQQQSYLAASGIYCIWDVKQNSAGQLFMKNLQNYWTNFCDIWYKRWVLLELVVSI
jgi:hypothetical protein